MTERRRMRGSNPRNSVLYSFFMMTLQVACGFVNVAAVSTYNYWICSPDHISRLVRSNTRHNHKCNSIQGSRSDSSLHFD